MKYLITFTVFLSSYFAVAQKFHTEYKYIDSVNKGITIQNSYPQGGLKYNSQIGKEFVYVVFWTCITNETNTNLELSINFPAESLTTAFSFDKGFRLFISKEVMEPAKETLFNYGLDVKSFLDKNLDKSSSLEKIIGPNESYSFYVVAISHQGVNGTVRAGFELKNQTLFHKINDSEFNCGHIIIKR